MRLAHTITVDVIAPPEEDVAKIKEGLLRLVPFDLVAEKLTVQERKAKGFNERTILTHRITLTKESHINEWVRWFVGKLSVAQRKLLWDQAETRLDEQNHFFLRIDKQAWFEDRIIITDLGNCYHIDMAIASFPARRENAMRVVESILYPHGWDAQYG